MNSRNTSSIKRCFDPDAFRRAREDAGWTIRNTSEATGIPVATLNRWSQGKVLMPQMRHLRRLRRALRLQEGTLLRDIPGTADDGGA